MTRAALQAAARRRDRRVHTRSHPLLFALLAATRRRPVARLGGTVLVHDGDAYRETLTRVPLDRTAAGTTGGAARELSAGGGLLFDQEGTDHRDTRRTVAEGLGATGVERLRPVWREVLHRHLAPLADPSRTVDLVPLARELAGATVCALLDRTPDPLTLADAAAYAAAATVRDHLPGPRRPGATRTATEAVARLEALLTRQGPEPHRPDADPVEAAGTAADAAEPARTRAVAAGIDGPPADRADAVAADADGAAAPGGADAALRAMLAVAAVNTTVAALPRAAAWCADAQLWDQAADAALRPVLVAELLRVVAPSPVLPRVAAADATVAGCPVRAGDRLVLVARHAAQAHRAVPDARHPAAPHVAQLVFGAGPHACPGARLARAQLDDLLAALAPYRPTVVRARVDRRAALPGWSTLTLRATTSPENR